MEVTEMKAEFCEGEFAGEGVRRVGEREGGGAGRCGHRARRAGHFTDEAVHGDAVIVSERPLKVGVELDSEIDDVSGAAGGDCCGGAGFRASEGDGIAAEGEAFATAGVGETETGDNAVDREIVVRRGDGGAAEDQLRDVGGDGGGVRRPVGGVGPEGVGTAVPCVVHGVGGSAGENDGEMADD